MPEIAIKIVRERKIAMCVVEGGKTCPNAGINGRRIDFPAWTVVAKKRTEGRI